MPRFDHCRSIFYIGEPHDDELSIQSKYGVPQVYKEIIKEHNADNPFEDPEFPHTNETVGNISFDSAQGKQYPDWDGTFHWKRIKEFLSLDPKHVHEPCFTTLEGPNGDEPQYSKHDILQGTIGDCWFISGLAEVTNNKTVMELLIPKDNLKNNDSGAYHFIMCHDGSWIDVVIDDWCPCAELVGPGKGWFLLGVKPVFTNEGRAKIWTIMLEKAYAKLNGSYHMIENNLPHNALEDLTGGLGYTLTFSPDKLAQHKFIDDLWGDLKKEQESGESVMVFGTDGRLGADGVQGLHALHAYTMTGITVLEEAGNVKLIRLRNPWGQGEWTGDWSDGSSKWETVSAATKEKLGFRAGEDGEFWIEFDNVLRLFAQVDFCLGIKIDYTELGKQGKRLEKFTYHSGWSIEKGTAGGDDNPAKNPQIIIYVGNEQADWDFDLIIALQPKASLAEASKLEYGYRVHWISDPTFQRWKLVDGFNFGPDFFEAPENKVVKTAGSSYGFDEVKTYNFGRDVTARFKVKAGTYLVVPTTGEPNVEADFVLRVWYDAYIPIGIVTRIESASCELNDDGTWTTTSSVQQL